jgi:FkbM family methyltransferase
MVGLKRRAADAVERMLGVRLVRPGSVAFVFEEEHLRQFFTHFKVDCVFDVGANGGQYATMIRERVGYRGAIVSFEPLPQLARELRELARNDPDWYIEEAALDRMAGTAHFNVMANSQFSSLHQSTFNEVDLFRQHAAVVQQIEVATSTVAIELAKYRERLGFRHPFLKIDTQGHDQAVAEGAGTALREFVGLQSELAIKRIYEGAPSYQEALQFYAMHGFELSAFVPNNSGHFPRLIEVDCIMYRA